MAFLNQPQQGNPFEQLQLQFQAEQTRDASLEHLLIQTCPATAQHDPAMPGGTALQTQSHLAHNMATGPDTIAQNSLILQQRCYAEHQQLVPSQLIHHAGSDRTQPGLFLSQLMPVSTSVNLVQASPDGGLPGVSGTFAMTPDIGMNPEAYLSLNSQSYLASTGTNLSPNDIYNSHAPSAPPSMISASSAADVPVPMTRENSSLGNPAAASMVRVASYRSHGIPEAHTGSVSATCNGVANSNWQHTEELLLQIGTTTGFLELPTSAKMERSDSNASAISIKSTASQRRAKEAAARVIKNGQAPILPKPQIVSSEGKGGQLNADGKLSGNRKYRRPQHPKVHCDQCGDHPEGFRGDHELRRHINAKHEGIVKKFVCRDPAKVGILSSLKLLYPLHKCKACNSRKQYGAYYNAAAHLRRTHFRLKPSRGRNKASSADEKRGGKGGGDWPPMAELKAWFEEVRVNVDRSDALYPDDEAVDMDMSGTYVNKVDSVDLNASVDVLYGAVDYKNFPNFNVGFQPAISPSTALSESPETLTSPMSTASTSFGHLDLGQSPAAFSVMTELDTELGSAPLFDPAAFWTVWLTQGIQTSAPAMVVSRPMWS